MTTREMLIFMKEQGYSLRLLAAQSSVSYFKLYRHMADAQRGRNLSYADKAAVWRFALVQPVLFERLYDDALCENKKTEAKKT